MFNVQRELHLTKSFFHEVSNQFQKILSSSTIKEFNEKKSQEEKTLPRIIFFLIKNFTKMYILRILFMIISSLSLKNLKKTGLLKFLFNCTFNKKNLSTATFVGILPFINDLLHLFFNNILLINTNNILFTFIFGFISGFISIQYEDMTSLVKFIILSILGRVIHSLIHLVTVRNNIRFESKAFPYFCFSVLASIFNIFNLFVPDFLPITKLSDKYSFFEGREFEEIQTLRRIYNIFK